MRKYLAYTIIMCCTISFKTNAQTLDRVCPRFMIAKSDGDKFEKTFTRYYKDFNRYADISTSSLILEKEQFLMMLRDIKSNSGNPSISVNGFRIFLAVENKKLKLVFTGLRDQTDTEDYYVINDNYTYSKITSQQEIESLSDQVTAYQGDLLKYANRVLCGSASCKNTATYIYNNSRIDEILHELEIQQDNLEITHIKFEVGAYPVNYKYYDFRKRIMVGFSFLKIQGSKQEEILIYKLPASNRHGCQLDDLKINDVTLTDSNSISKKNSLNDKKLLKELSFLFKTISGDTGVPCPPGNGCGTPSLPKQ